MSDPFSNLYFNYLILCWFNSLDTHGNSVNVFLAHQKLQSRCHATRCYNNFSSDKGRCRWTKKRDDSTNFVRTAKPENKIYIKIQPV